LAFKEIQVKNNSRNVNLTWIRKLGLIATAGLLLGCGRGTGPELAWVEGDVTFNGIPATFAIIEFQPAEKGSPSIGFADEDGHYRLQFSQGRQGAMVGQHTVRITFDDDPSPDSPPPIRVPAKYNTQSELKVEVKRGSNEHDFDLRADHQMASNDR
jgi:hypothetical protein